MATIDPNRRNALEALRYLADMLEREPEFERLIDGYLETRRTLATAFMLLARSQLTLGTSLLEEAAQEVHQRMLEQFLHVVPDRYLKVRSYSDVHKLILGYLHIHMGRLVPASRLRVLTADQVETERRLRELREFGFRIDSRKTGGENQYLLEDGELNLDQAVRFQITNAVNGDRGLGAAAKVLILSELGPEAERER